MTLPEPLLRRAGLGDAAALSLIGGATFLYTFAHDHPGPGLVAHARGDHGEAWYAAALADPANALWLLETPLGAPVGYAMLCPPALEDAAGPDDLELKRIYLLDRWAGGGRGRALMTAAEVEARARGAQRLLLSVYEHNLLAQGFYARLGYTDTGLRRTFMTGDFGSTDQVWAKPLD
ncbi:GNAT family N-acetyltransferase [Sphingomonas jatrophae]|uniref:Acetyltransferase (GNAT) family protein n=1 Tax=Sphingomonas jatrophae TaxID=1166337 RepID=A0A1I6M6F3_9SPHN|nr:GNAT family N-acetyltransferase [Sphingomonas jatrophae]SFS11188.1 Acetyltransferase (GNAT) family protein [Sphingomonas jatrophae]